VLIAAEVGVFVASVDLLAYVPLFFFAATLHFVAIELMIEWLWDSRKRMTSKEYLVSPRASHTRLGGSSVHAEGLCASWSPQVLWITFIGDTFLGIIEGFALGIVCSMAAFIISYAKVQARASQPMHRQRSRVVR
jgi:MFS superfamily sulfate permease-like transporter